jgi:hypothetical protein
MIIPQITKREMIENQELLGVAVEAEVEASQDLQERRNSLSITPTLTTGSSMSTTISSFRQ